MTNIIGYDYEKKLNKQVNITSDGYINTDIHEPTTIYGDLRSINLNPTIKLTFPYNIDSASTSITTAGSGTSSFSGSMLELGTNIRAKWVAVGNTIYKTQNILYSTNNDGISWNVAYMVGGGSPFTGPGAATGGEDVAYGGGNWVAVGKSENSTQNILYSTNGGVSWNIAHTIGGGSPFFWPRRLWTRCSLW